MSLSSRHSVGLRHPLYLHDLSCKVEKSKTLGLGEDKVNFNTALLQNCRLLVSLFHLSLTVAIFPSATA